MARWPRWRRGEGAGEAAVVAPDQAAAVAASLPPLLVEATRVASGVVQGVHGRRRPGPGDSFWQFRRYQPGDPATAIDWRQSAKSDPLYVRETEWAAAQSVWLWADPSASMHWRSSPELPEKQGRAVLLALALAVLLVRGGERVAHIGQPATPSADRSALARLAATLPQGAADQGLPDAPLPRHARAVIISDFLMPPAAVEAALHRWSGSGVRGHLVQLLDPAEESLPYEGRVLFSGLEGEDHMLAPRAEALRDAYRERLRRHREQLSAMAGKVGWTFAVHHTDAPPRPVLATLHAEMSGR